MKDKNLPYFLTISSTIYQIKILVLTFFPILGSFTLLPYQTNKELFFFYRVKHGLQKISERPGGR